MLWVQEEPVNMGAWPFICRKFSESEFNFKLVSRKESSSTATGYAKQHIAHQLSIIGKAFEDAAGSEIKKKVESITDKVINVD